MAAALVTKGTTAEDQLLELIDHVAGLQTDTAKNPQNVSVISNYSRNGLTGALSATITLPVSTSANATTGKPQLDASEVFL